MTYFCYSDAATTLLGALTLFCNFVNLSVDFCLVLAAGATPLGTWVIIFLRVVSRLYLTWEEVTVSFWDYRLIWFEQRVDDIFLLGIVD